jgi:rod shape-determining protein MreC
VAGLRTLLDRHRAASLVAGLALGAALFPAGPFGARASLAGFLAPLARLRPQAPPGAPAAGSAERIRSLEVMVEELRAENRSLKEFRSLRLEESVRGVRAIQAGVLMRDPKWPHRLSLLLDRGSADGLKRGFPVVVGWSLAGFVVEAGARTSLVQLLDDPARRGSDALLSVGVKVLRPGGTRSFEGALSGERRGVLKVKHLAAGSVARGDIVTTSAADPSVPAGLLVGVVSSVEEDRQLGLATAFVTPSADLASVRTVVVLVLPEVDRTLLTGRRR